jgi:hypothetical protein
VNTENNFIGPRMPLDIPLFLFIPQEERKLAWAVKGGLPTQRKTEFTETCKNWDEWVKLKREMVPEHTKAKNAAGLARLKEKHAGQKYDRKTKTWVRVVENEDAL